MCKDSEKNVKNCVYSAKGTRFYLVVYGDPESVLTKGIL